MRKGLSIILIGLLCVFCNLALANVEGNLGNFFDDLNFAGNVDSAKAWKAQEAGYYSGGSVYLRSQVQTAQLVHLDLPSYSAGCGGIDLYLGGFSYISGEELGKFFHQIASKAIGYGVSLALQTYVPQIKATTDQLVDWVQSVNNANISSCELSQDLLGGLLPKSTAMNTKLCKDIGSQNNIFGDWAEGRQKCKEARTRQKTNQIAESNPKYKKETLVHKNLIWAVLKDRPFLSTDRTLAEFCMSLTGTIIFQDEEKGVTLPSLVDDRNLMKALLYGGQAEVYVCDEMNKCLNPSKRTLSIAPNRSLITRVTSLLNRISTRVKNDEPLDNEEQGFVNTTALPIEKYTAVGLMMNPKFQMFNLSAYAEPIALQLLHQYLKELLGIVRISLSASDYMEEVQSKLTHNIAYAESVVASQKIKTHQSIQDWAILTQRSEKIEQHVTANLSSLLGQSLGEGA